MLKEEDKIFTNLSGKLGNDLSSSKKRGIWSSAYKIITKYKPIELVEIVKNSGLRGRGGAGFPTGMKWSFLSKDRAGYLVINADESEPGTCKDRDILRYDPHKLLEAIMISSYAIEVNVAYIYIRGEFYNEALILEKAIHEAYDDGLIGQNALKTGHNIEIYLHRGAGAYICGEESALLESLEGKKGQPRLKPPFPAASGLYGAPTIINNVETIAVIPEIINRGAEWFKNIGSPNNAGSKIFSIAGHVNKPCNIEESLGISLKELIEKYAGGVIGGWDNLKAVIPGGSSTPMLPKSIADEVLMDFDSLKAAGSALGTGAILVMNKSTNLIEAIRRLSKFYMHESCGQCTPCREGTGWLFRILNRINNKTATKDDIDKLWQISKNMEGNTICALADAAAWPIQGLIRLFKNEIIIDIENK